MKSDLYPVSRRLKRHDVFVSLLKKRKVRKKERKKSKELGVF